MSSKAQALANSKSAEERMQWMRHVHEVQSKRTPEAWEAARQRIELSRQREVSYRKCKAVKGHAVRSRALAAEGLRQMAESSAPHEHMAVQQRWKSAQEASNRRQELAWSKADEATRSADTGTAALALAPAELLDDAEEEEEQAMEEAAALVGAADMRSMAALGAEGLPAPGAPAARGGSGGGTVEALLAQLRTEPADEAECAAKFMLYEAIAAGRCPKESRPTVPSAVASDMDKQVAGIDSAEAMGIPDDAREWFVYHMMRQAERNNLKMAAILDSFEKKLEFLASNDQAECPVCLESFKDDGPHVPETLSCCHKVCKDCWENWSAVMHGRPFCPLCRHDEFLGAVAARVPGSGGP